MDEFEMLCTTVVCRILNNNCESLCEIAKQHDDKAIPDEEISPVRLFAT